MEELKGFDFVVKVHENLLERPLTKYEFRLARSVYYSAVGETLKEKERLDENKTHNNL